MGEDQKSYHFIQGLYLSVLVIRKIEHKLQWNS